MQVLLLFVLSGQLCHCHSAALPEHGEEKRQRNKNKGEKEDKEETAAGFSPGLGKPLLLSIFFSLPWCYTGCS